MKFPKSLLFSTLTLTLTLTASAQTRFQASPHGSHVRVEGTSTLHDWEMEGTLVGGSIEFPAGVTLDPAQTTIAGATDGKIAVKAQAIIPVRSVTSNKPTMDGLMQETLKEPQYKRIEYKLSELKLKAPHAANTPFEFDATGDLAISGTTNKITFPVTIERIGIDRMKVTGTTPLKMTAYGVKPPAPNILGIGVLKCGDDLTIKFEWALAEKK